jgi:ABC-2 type transport system permease protein
MLPLELLPHGLRAVVDWLPFRFLLSFPVETMLGLRSVRAACTDLAVQWLYLAIFLAATLRLWRAGVKRYAAYGG